MNSAKQWKPKVDKKCFSLIIQLNLWVENQISASLKEASAAIGGIHQQSHYAVFSFSLYIHTFHFSAWYMGVFTPLTVWLAQ